jgi:hypothetical protein
MPTYEEIKERFEKEDKLEFFEQGINDACEKIMRQTDYSREVSFEKLKEHNMDIMAVVRDWMGVVSIKKPERTSNQMVFDEFRSFLDDASSSYYKKKELQKAQEEYVQQMREAARIELERRKLEAADKNPLQTIDEDPK